MRPPIQVWAYDEAPAELREPVDSCGDEDYLALVPPGYGDPDVWGRWPRWLEHPHFAGYRVKHYAQPDGSTVVVGWHG